MPVYTISMHFTAPAPGNNVLIDFTQSSASFTWVMAPKSGVQITPGTPGTPFACSAFSVNATQVSVTPAATDPFTIQLSFSPTGAGTTTPDILIGTMNLTAGTVVVTIPQLNQTTTVVAGEPDFSLPLNDNN